MTERVVAVRSPAGEAQATTPSGPRRLNVVVDGAILERPWTGTARWVRGIATALERHGDVDVVIASGPRHLRGGGRLHRLPNLLRERWWYEQGIGRVARRARADVMLMPANLTARPGRIPQVATILDVNFLTQPGTYERTLVRYATWAYRRSIRDAAQLTTISRFSRSEISKHLGIDPTRIEVIYPGLDEVGPRPAGPPPLDRSYALYAGATEVHKNVGLLVRAWRERSPAGLTLVIAGQPGRDHSSILDGALRSGGRVVVRGRVDADELDRWYRYASVFLFPSRVEGFGFPPLEAMQRGVPVLASTTGSLPEVLGDGALFFDPDDAESLVALIESLMAEPRVREDLIARGIARAETYTWAASAEAMFEALQRVVN